MTFVIFQNVRKYWIRIGHSELYNTARNYAIFISKEHKTKTKITEDTQYFETIIMYKNGKVFHE